MAEPRGGFPRDPRGCSRARRGAGRLAGSDFYSDVEPPIVARIPHYTAVQRQALSAAEALHGHVFDTDAGLPLWFDGTNWVDATGTIVP